MNTATEPWLEWAPGMLTKCGWRVVSVNDDGGMRIAGECYCVYDCDPEEAAKMEPDTDDDATVGCLRGLMREIWEDKHCCSGFRTGGTAPLAVVPSRDRYFSGETEVDAIINACRAGWELLVRAAAAAGGGGAA